MPGMRLGVAILVWPVMVAGATLEKLSVEEMAAKSTAIVRAKAVSSAAGFSPDA